jgi:hypothetical protein
MKQWTQPEHLPPSRPPPLRRGNPSRPTVHPTGATIHRRASSTPDALWCLGTPAPSSRLSRPTLPRLAPRGHQPLLRDGLTTPEVASISGHRDIRMLMRYAHRGRGLSSRWTRGSQGMRHKDLEPPFNSFRNLAQFPEDHFAKTVKDLRELLLGLSQQ